MLYRSVLTVSGSPHNVELLDVSGERLQDEVVDWAEAFIIVYSITDDKSLITSKETLDIITSKRPDVPVLLAGNKSDLGHHRQVFAHEAKQLAQNYEAKHTEVSAAEDCDSVSAAFDLFLKDVKVYRNKASPRYRKLSPTKLIGSLVCRYSTVQTSTKLIVLDKREQARLTSAPCQL